MENYDTYVNHADFWSLAATIGIEEGIKAADFGARKSRKFCFDYYWGRKECISAPLTRANNVFPDPTMSLEQMFNYYDTQFGFGPREVARIQHFSASTEDSFAGCGYYRGA